MVSTVSKQQLRARFRALRREQQVVLQQWLDRLAAADLVDLLAARPRPAAGPGSVGLWWPLADVWMCGSEAQV